MEVKVFNDYFMFEVFDSNPILACGYPIFSLFFLDKVFLMYC